MDDEGNLHLLRRRLRHRALLLVRFPDLPALVPTVTAEDVRVVAEWVGFWAALSFIGGATYVLWRRHLDRLPTHRMTRATRQRSLRLKEKASMPAPTINPVDDAATLDAAADLIEHDHLSDDMWWTGPSTYTVGARVDAFGAVAVVLGIRHTSDMPRLGADGVEPLHPALAALLIHLLATSQVDLINGTAGVEQIYAWSDQAASEEQVVATLRQVARELRAGVAQ